VRDSSRRSPTAELARTENATARRDGHTSPREVLAPGVCARRQTAPAHGLGGGSTWAEVLPSVLLNLLASLSANGLSDQVAARGRGSVTRPTRGAGNPTYTPSCAAVAVAPALIRRLPAAVRWHPTAAGTPDGASLERWMTRNA